MRVSWGGLPDDRRWTMDDRRWTIDDRDQGSGLRNTQYAIRNTQYAIRNLSSIVHRPSSSIFQHFCMHVIITLDLQPGHGHLAQQEPVAQVRAAFHWQRFQPVVL